MGDILYQWRHHASLVRDTRTDHHSSAKPTQPNGRDFDSGADFPVSPVWWVSIAMKRC